MESNWMTPRHRSFRPPSWPPPKDWVVSEDRDGKILSRWGDPVWDLSPWAGRSEFLNFGDGESNTRAISLDGGNAYLLRLIATWQMWGPKAARKVASLKARMVTIRRIISFCSQSGINAAELMKFPRVLETLISVIPPSEFNSTIVALHRLWDVREEIGFSLVEPAAIKRLAAASPVHHREQTAYIPPRIWSYQLQRLRACLDDYHDHKKKVEDCFNFCVDAYAMNCGSLENALLLPRQSNELPFRYPKSKNFGKNVGRKYHGPFVHTAERFGIKRLLEKWVEIPSGGLDVRQLSSYLTLVQFAGLAYISNFTLQRVTETASMRADCLVWEVDEKLGRVPIVCGETSKTISDSDARWPTSPSVEVAIAAMDSIARLRMRCAAANSRVSPTAADQSNPYLIDRASEPWCGNKARPYSLRGHIAAYAIVDRDNPRLFDSEHLRITDEDLRIARMLTPNLSAGKGFVVGQVWPLAWHQLRRTGAVNMFASGLLSDSSIQFQMKHASRLMPLYYGSGYTKLQLNEEVERTIISAMYEVMAHNIQSATRNRFVSPHGPDRKDTVIINLIGDKDAKSLAEAAKRGKVSFREIRLGACTKRGACPYGGIESVARCAGGDGNSPCADALFDRTKAHQFQKELEMIDLEISNASQDSPQKLALLAERKALENFLNVVQG